MSNSLKIGSAAAQPISELGVNILATLRTTATAEDVLQITAPGPLDGDAIIAPFQRVALIVDGTTRFVGWLDQAPQKSVGGGNDWTYILTGPWRWLMRCHYLAPTLVDGTKVNAASGFTRLGAKVAYVPPTDPDLSEADAEHTTVRAQLVEILNYAQAQHPGMWNYTLPNGIFDIEIPFEDRENDLCGNIIRALLAYAPTMVMWWDYSESVPRLHFANPTGDAADRTLTAENLIELPVLNPRYELLANQVSITYLSQRDDEVTPEEDAAPETRTRVDRNVETSGSGGDAAELEADFVYRISFSLQRGEAQPEAGLANTLAAYFQRLHIDTQATFIEIDWDRTPGELWGFGGIFARHSTRRSICREIVRDLFLGTESIVIGAPSVPSTYNLGKRALPSPPPAPPPSPPGGDDEPTGTINVTITGLADESLATWTVVGPSTSAGSGDDEVEVPVGGYNVVFDPIITDDGRFFSAPSVSGVTVTDGSEEAVSGDYEEKFIGGVHPWKGVVIDDTSFKVIPSTIGGHVPPGMEPGNDYIISGGAGKLYGVYNYNTSTGDYISVELVQSSGDLDNEDGILRMPILQWSTDGDRIVPVNLRETPINVSEPCLQWYTSPPKYGRGIS